MVKICIFLKKFEIFGMHLSLYLFCHLLLLTLLCAFFTIKTIKKIWTQKNYPNTQFYLLYGLLSNIIIWAIYKIFLCLIDIQDKVLELVKLKNEPKNNEKIIVFEKEINREENNALIEEKYKSLMKNFKFRIIIFYIIIFVFTIFCFIYLVSFFGIYTGTKGYVFMAYLISIVEILLIKLVYGICLASLRIASEGNRLKWLYKVVYVFDKYIS